MRTTNSKQPIGIFDSGIGGLTVANAINKILPNEQLIYFGDTAHFPYGDKSPDSIKYYSIRIAKFLIDNNCKAIVIACNTASSQAYETVKDFVADKAIVFNVIDPVVEKVTASGAGSIGVIGTKGTIKSNVYATKINQVNQNIKVASLATPLLAPMIEEGLFNNKISKSIINSYLSKAKLKNIDSLILACTHYPLIKQEIEEFYKKNVNILDSAEIVAQHVKKNLAEKKMLNQGKNLNHHFYVSDFTDSFEQSTRFFFKNKIHLEEVSIWK
ncbi:MAG: glutamate racemase [Bacteroidetes bacterium]|nr:glutamate racemase [Bacteroidota bacterium]HET6245516.1 glutamate racemase [Bacteroidia bacterium]